MKLDPELAAMLATLKSEGVEGLGRLPPPQERVRFSALWRRLDGESPQDVSAREITLAGVPCRLYIAPDAPAKSGGLVYFHGGGFVVGDLDSYDALCRRLAKAAHCKVISVDYRLAPEHPVPAAHDDALAVMGAVFAQAEALGLDPRRIAMGGDSAGGNLTASTAIALRNAGGPQACFQLLIYPAVGGGETESQRRCAEGYMLDQTAIAYFTAQMGLDPTKDISRILVMLTPDLSGLPPAYIATAGFDPLRDEGAAYAARLADAGVRTAHVDFPDMLHGFANMTKASVSARRACDAMGAALERALSA